MNFGEAIKAAQDGKKIKRQGWNGKAQFVVFMPPTQIDAGLINGRTRAHVGTGVSLDVGGYFVIAVMPDDPTLSVIRWQPGWLASQADILAEDWQTVDA